MIAGPALGPSWAIAEQDAADLHRRSYRRLVDENLIGQALHAAVAVVMVRHQAGLAPWSWKPDPEVWDRLVALTVSELSDPEVRLPRLTLGGWLEFEEGARLVPLELWHRPGVYRVPGTDQNPAVEFVPAFGEPLMLRRSSTGLLEARLTVAAGGSRLSDRAWTPLDTDAFRGLDLHPSFVLGAEGRQRLDAALADRGGDPYRRVPSPEEIAAALESDTWYSLDDRRDWAALRLAGVGEILAQVLYRWMSWQDPEVFLNHPAMEKKLATELASFGSRLSRPGRTPVARLGERLRVHLGRQSISPATGAGRLSVETGDWPGPTGLRPTAQLHPKATAGAPVDADDGGVSWIGELIPYGEFDDRFAHARGIRAHLDAAKLREPRDPAAPGRLVGAPPTGADAVVALVPSGLGDRAVVVSESLVRDGRFDAYARDGTVMALTVGDVIFDRHGTGGVVAAVWPDAAMPVSEDGRPTEVLVDSLAVVEDRAFGTLAELEASFGVLHLLRQERKPPELVSQIRSERAAFAIAGAAWAREVTLVAAVPDPTLGADECRIPPDLAGSDMPSSILAVGPRSAGAVGFRVIGPSALAIHLPPVAASLFARPWTGEQVRVVGCDDDVADACSLRARPLDRGSGRSLLAVSRQGHVEPFDLRRSRLRPAAAIEELDAVPAQLTELQGQYDRGVLYTEELHLHRTQALQIAVDRAGAALSSAADADPDGPLAQLRRAGLLRRLLPAFADPDGSVGGPFLVDPLGGIPPDVRALHLAPDGLSEDWPAFARMTTHLLCVAGDRVAVSEADCQAGHPVDERGPFTCIAADGVCAACVGVLPGESAPPTVGTRIGLVAARAVGSVLPDLWLRVFHMCGTNLPVQHGALRVHELILHTDPEDGSAQLASAAGTVEYADGQFVLRDADGLIFQTFEARGAGTLVHGGERVEAGEALTSGPIPLRMLFQLAGRAACLRYVADDLTSIVADFGIAIPLRLIECLALGIGSAWRIEEWT